MREPDNDRDVGWHKPEMRINAENQMEEAANIQFASCCACKLFMTYLLLRMNFRSNIPVILWGFGAHKEDVHKKCLLFLL